MLVVWFGAKWLHVAELVNGLFWQFGLFELPIRIASYQLVGPRTDGNLVSDMTAAVGRLDCYCLSCNAFVAA
jgi:hypothetical protein